MKNMYSTYVMTVFYLPVRGLTKTLYSSVTATAHWSNLRKHCEPRVQKFGLTRWMATLKNVMVDSVEPTRQTADQWSLKVTAPNMVGCKPQNRAT